MSFLTRASRTSFPLCRSCIIAQHSVQVRYASSVLNSTTISSITSAEKSITGQDQPIKGGPTAQAQKHAGEEISSSTIADISKGERKITGKDQPARDGPTSVAQSKLSRERDGSSLTGAQAGNASGNAASGVLDSATIAKIADAERKIAGTDELTKGGPTAQAQKQAGEVISSGVLSDITAGEKGVFGDRVKGAQRAWRRGVE